MSWFVWMRERRGFFLAISVYCLTLLWRRFLLYRNQSIDLLSKLNEIIEFNEIQINSFRKKDFFSVDFLSALNCKDRVIYLVLAKKFQTMVHQSVSAYLSVTCNYETSEYLPRILLWGFFISPSNKLLHLTPKPFTVEIMRFGKKLVF